MLIRTIKRLLRLARAAEPPAPVHEIPRARIPPDGWREDTGNVAAAGHLSSAEVDSLGPGKNVLMTPDGIDSKRLRRILDNPLLDVEEEDGAYDPYNTGRFDRSRSWQKAKR